MITVTFLYPNKAGSRFNTDYYIDVRMPLAIKRLGPALKGVPHYAELQGDIPNYTDMSR